MRVEKVRRKEVVEETYLVFANGSAIHVERLANALMILLIAGMLIAALF